MPERNPSTGLPSLVRTRAPRASPAAEPVQGIEPPVAISRGLLEEVGQHQESLSAVIELFIRARQAEVGASRAGERLIELMHEGKPIRDSHRWEDFHSTVGELPRFEYVTEGVTAEAPDLGKRVREFEETLDRALTNIEDIVDTTDDPHAEELARNLRHELRELQNASRQVGRACETASRQSVNTLGRLVEVILYQVKTATTFKDAGMPVGPSKDQRKPEPTESEKATQTPGSTKDAPPKEARTGQLKGGTATGD
jgi:hypothetical protein